MVMQRLTVNLSGAVRYDVMEGREYLVAPMVMMTVGVHNGSEGPLYYPEDEMQRNPGVWNHKPVVVYHPSRNGQGISACDPDILSNRKVGVIMNARYDDKKWKAEAWLEPERLKVVDDRVLDALETGTMMELSTGLVVDNESSKGEFEGVPYEAIARNYMPDHLALLPDKIGSCSIEDGAGLLRNELSQNEVFTQLSDRLQERFGATEKFVFVQEVFANYAIYEVDNTLWKITYTKKKDIVKLGDNPIRVNRKVLYTTMKGDVLGNGSYPYCYLTEKEPVMAKKEELVDALIKNETSDWKEDDREGLGAFSEERLEAFSLVENKKKEKTDLQKAAEKGAEELNPTVLKPVENATPEKKKEPVTAEQYIENAPAEVREVLSEGIATSREQKKALVKGIIANEQNIFTEEHLADKSLAELRGIHALAHKASKDSPEPSYVGAVGTSPVTNVEKSEEPLLLPELSFS